MQQPTTLHALLGAVLDAQESARLFDQLQIAPALLRPLAAEASRAELAQALNMLLFRGLLERVPLAVACVAERRASGQKVCFDHGALRTVAWPSGALPAGQAAITRVLVPLGFEQAETYPLPRLKMTGRAWRHRDLPQDIAQFFVSELHPEAFSPAFQATVSRVIGDSRDPLSAQDLAELAQLERDRALPLASAQRLLPRLAGCFERQHGLFAWDDYESLRAESAEMAWIATEGNAFNHATDRVDDIDAVVELQRRAGRPVKSSVEVSASGRVRQTALAAAPVLREFRQGQGVIAREVPGSFYEFIARAPLPDEAILDLGFDAANATGIFGMTAAGAR
ncbi:2-oxoadipate dioxygenase/decarboxylase family protein [Rivibacter subsaxonicus]|nr:DUF1338 family protein [Rivibacter subsaxonicus]